MSDVRVFPGASKPDDGTPNEELVAMLEKMVKLAKSGQLQSFIGTGFSADKHRVAFWADTHDNVYEMLGAIEWLRFEYEHKWAELMREFDEFGPDDPDED